MTNGQTRILTFKPILDDNTDNSANTSEKAKIELLEQFTETFNEKISVINEKIDKIEKYLKPAKVKKEVDSDV
jgi:Mg2+ and Co2+ transporter CorA